MIKTALSLSTIGPSTWRRLCLAIFAAATAVSGQPSAVDNASRQPSAPDRPLQLRFAAFALPGGSASFVLLEIDREGGVVERSEPFIVASRNLGAPVSVSRRRLALASASANAPLGAQLSEVDALVPLRLPETGDVFIALLVPTAGKPGKLEPVVLQADTAAMPPGSIRFFNLGDSRLAWRLGEKTGILEARGRASVDPPEREDGRAAFPVEFYFEKEQSARRFASTTWVYRSAVRSFVFFFPDAETGRYRYRVFEDFPAWIE